MKSKKPAKPKPMTPVKPDPAKYVAGLHFKSWSASRLADYTQCPFRSALKHLRKLCPMCFSGKITGGYDRPAVCGVCNRTVKDSPALARGTRIGQGLEQYVLSKTHRLPEEIRNEVAQTRARDLRRRRAKKDARDWVLVEHMVQFDANWKPLRAGWTPTSWLIVKMDIFTGNKTTGHVIDWKTGGLMDGKPKHSETYEEQLLIYSVAGLSALQSLARVTAELCFVDTDIGNDPIVVMPGADGTTPGYARSDLPAAQKRLEQRVRPLFNDTTFAPRAGDHCRFCPYKRSEGGPCPY